MKKWKEMERKKEKNGKKEVEKVLKSYRLSERNIHI